MWAAFVALQIVALLLGLWLGRGRDKAAKASLHTARLLGLIGSSGLLVVLSLVLWSVIIFDEFKQVAGDPGKRQWARAWVSRSRSGSWSSKAAASGSSGRSAAE